jgi:hypothetical protein
MSITRDQLIQFIENPSLLKEQTIGELKEIIDEFPYFQSAQLLYTYNLFSQSNFRYSGYLKTCSIYATDRTILYHLLQPTSRALKTPLLTTKIDETENQSSELFELAEETLVTEAEFSQLSSMLRDEGGTIDLDLLSFDQQDNFYPLDETDSGPDIAGLSVPDSAKESSVDQKVDLIEQFIKVNPTIQPRIENISERSEIFDIMNEPGNEIDEYITETLSRIYLKQGHYQKAIDSFSRLSLKFPEKSVYFAQQIE